MHSIALVTLSEESLAMFVALPLRLWLVIVDAATEQGWIETTNANNPTNQVTAASEFCLSCLRESAITV